MGEMIQLLDCTLRDGAYIVDAQFGESSIKGIIEKLQAANVDIIECGWLKNGNHISGTSFYHTPNDLKRYLSEKHPGVTYVAMIDWDRYDLRNLPFCDGESIDAIRVVFPHGKSREGIAVGKEIIEKGYKVYFQAANTLAYSNDELKQLADTVNEVHPEGVSVVDTFGAMYFDDLQRICNVLDKYLESDIKLGFHSHNNQQLSFALSMKFAELFQNKCRNIVIDASLCGMGRGAGNATTELIVNYLNSKHNGRYDMDEILDAIDIYMSGYQNRYNWGYSTSYFIAGMYGCHVNNIAYLTKNHRTNAKDMRNIIDSLSVEERRKYDYDLLERKYIENQSRLVDDYENVQTISNIIAETPILLIAPGKSSVSDKEQIDIFIKQNRPIIIAVNALLGGYDYDYLFLTNKARYDYACTSYTDLFMKTDKLLLSNIKTIPDRNEYIFNFNRAVKRGWDHFDNAVICCLRLLDKLGAKKVYIAGFDGFKDKYNESYADVSLPTINPGKDWNELNKEIKEMFYDVRNTSNMEISCITDTIYEEEG